MTADIFVYFIPLPNRIRGFTTPCANGNYTIYINEALTDQQKEETYRHELAHIERGDFERINMGVDVDMVECKTHRRK